MSKVPYVERAYGDSGLTGECAYLWTLFLMREAEVEDDGIAYDKWKSMAETLQPREGKPVPASVYYAALEKEIERYTKEKS